MKQLRIIALILALTTACFVLSGCLPFTLIANDDSNNNDNDKGIAAMSLDYIEEKYGEEFEYFQPWGNSMNGTYQMLATCESLSEPVLIEVENYREDDRVFRDNYLAVKYKQETIDFLQECAVAEFGEANVYYDVNRTGQSELIAADATFEEFIADTRATVAADIEIRGSDYTSREQIERLAESIASSGVYYRILIIVIDDEVYDTLEIEELKRKVVRKEFVECAQIDHFSDGIEIIWREKE